MRDDYDSAYDVDTSIIDSNNRAQTNKDDPTQSGKYLQFLEENF